MNLIFCNGTVSAHNSAYLNISFRYSFCYKAIKSTKDSITRSFTVSYIKATQIAKAAGLVSGHAYFHLTHMPP